MGRPPAVQKIFAEVARKYSVPTASITGDVNHKPMPQARAEIAWRLKRELKHEPSLNEIARYLNRHHTSVVKMLKRRPQIQAAEWETQKDQPDISGEWAI
jgi:chromosomal replication initiation ATPase DnaA